MQIARFLSVLAALGLSFGAAAAGDLRFEATLPYTTGEILDVNAKVGEVEVSSVEITVLASATSIGGKLAGGLSKLRGTDDETRSAIQLAFECVNATKQDWEITFTIELLDGEGKLIDRVSREEDFRMESEVYKIQHETLSYVLPLIKQVKIRLDAELD